MENLKVIKGNFDEYIKWNGLRLAEDEFGLNIKNGKTDYYVVLDGDKFFSEFFVFVDNMEVNLNITGRFPEIYKVMLEALKENYDVLTFTSDEETYNNFVYIKELVEIISEDKDVFELQDNRVFTLNKMTCRIK